MIGKLSGIVDEINSNYIILNVNGVGYLVYMFFISKLHIDQNISILIKTIVKEDSLDLYGFLAKEDYLFFNTLIQINGIGPKNAMNILDKLGANRLQAAISSNDANVFKQISGVGPKLAAKILLELKGKVILKSSKSAIFYEAIEILQQLGFDENLAEKFVSKILEDHKIKQNNQPDSNDSNEIALEDIVTFAIKMRNET
ncbi:MAG: Holliday junction branch migration protein RuvA [Rickettsiales bacterium]